MFYEIVVGGGGGRLLCPGRTETGRARGDGDDDAAHNLRNTTVEMVTMRACVRVGRDLLPRPVTRRRRLLFLQFHDEDIPDVRFRETETTRPRRVRPAYLLPTAKKVINKRCIVIMCWNVVLEE